MRRLVLPLVCAAAASAASACSLLDVGEAPGADTSDPACQIDSDAEHGPGWPYDLAQFEARVLPALQTSCAGAGCHAAPVGAGNFTVFAGAAPGNCDYAKTFNGMKPFVDLVTPENSRMVIAVRGDLPAHPLKLGADDPTTKLLLEYAQKASANANTTVAPPGASPFDYAVYQTVIQPIFDAAEQKGCAGASCHGGAAGINGFRLLPAPATGSAEMEQNFLAATSRASLDTPESSTIYLKATTRHGGGASAVVDEAQAKAILDWIVEAQKNAAPDGGAGCVPASAFNVEVFRDDVLPVLFGKVGSTTGCALGACHGADRSGGALVLKESLTPEQNLQNFACFINLENPVASEILACPLDQAPCRHRPHPGQDVFGGATDPAFQKVLSYLYSAKTASTPLDFAFYARAVNPIFNDVTAVQGGAQNRTCADAAACHGVSAAGQRAANGSNFPIIANLTDPASLAANFSAASNFVNFIQPIGSSLFLYPTNEIANPQNPFATGLAHPGGADFAVDSREAQIILTWARGLRPDAEGFVRYWLVAGDYSATQVTSPTLIDESGAAPKIFDPSGAAQFNQGQWDALISEAQVIDLGAEFPRAQNPGRVAYAVVYLINTTPVDVRAQVTVTTPNAVRVIVDGAPIVQSDAAQGGVTGLVTLPAFGSSKKGTRVMIKLFQRPGDAEFSFDVRLADELGTPLTGASGEIVVKLSPGGGV